MIKEIFTKLKETGLNPYWPGKHQGECTQRYCVPKESNLVPYYYSNKVGYRVLDIIAFIPASSYIQMEPYVKEIRAVLRGFPLRYAGETPVVTDDVNKAYTTSIQYQILKKLEG